MLEYRVREGENNASKKPAIILIHGYGSHADDLFSFAPYFAKNLTIIALQAPLALGPNSFAWYPLQIDSSGEITSDVKTAWEAVKLIVNTLDELVEKHQLNPNDISLLGFSQGAILSWAIAYHHSEKIRRIVALSGMVHQSIDTREAPKFSAYASHGIYDEVIPISQSRNTILPLSKKHKSITYLEFEDGHSVSQKNFTQLLEWLEKSNL
jgi:phospholipase/carboxylesterase